LARSQLAYQHWICSKKNFQNTFSEKSIMRNWFMLTLVGKDHAGIVAKITETLYLHKCNLGEASMTRLGGSFTIMLMAQFEGDAEELNHTLQPVCDSLNLRHHVDEIEGELHHHLEPDVRLSVHGADRAGIVAQVTRVLADAGLNILNLESDVGGTTDNPLYIMHMEGMSSKGIDALKSALKVFEGENDVKVHLSEIETLRG
jgi:glycine cleavage system transcriptional repressor